MHPIDWVLAGLLGFSAWRGYKTGLLLVLINTVALVAAIVVGLKFLDVTSQWLSAYVEAGKTVLPLLAFALLFAATFFFLRWFAGFASKSLKQTLLGPIDQAGGALLGLFRTAFVLSSLLLGLDMLGIKISPGSGADPVLLPLLREVSPVTLQVLAPLLPFLKKLIAEYR